MGVRGEDLGKGVSHLDLAIKGYLLGNGSVERHQEARVVVVMLSNRGIVVMLKAGLEAFLGGVEGVLDPIFD